MRESYGMRRVEWTQEDHERDVEQAFAWLRNVMRQANVRARAGCGTCACDGTCGRSSTCGGCRVRGCGYAYGGGLGHGAGGACGRGGTRGYGSPTGGPTVCLPGYHAGVGFGAPAPYFGATDAPASSSQQQIVRKLAAMVMAHEGGYDAVNRNADGAGASIGIYQWPQRSGDLGKLLQAYYRADPARFVRIFGPQYRELLRVTANASMEPVGGAVLWAEPWVSRFQAAGRDPVFQAVQDRMAMNGVHMRAAFSVANILGFLTERSLALVLDAVVSQGPGAAEGIARKVRKLYAGQVAPMREVLSAYLELGVSQFHRTSAPTAPPKAAHLSWRKVGSEWHIYAGQIDLYANIMKRRGQLLTHPELSDEPLPRDSAVA